MEKIERVPLDELKLGRQGIHGEVRAFCPCARLGECLVGTVSSDGD